MATINDTFINALLADASYVDDLDPGFTGVDLSNALAPRMTQALANFMGVNFTVITSINTPDYVIAGAGFDGVIWRGNAGTPYAGKLFVSMRGTEGPADFVTDANLALYGDAAQQTADMVSWWLRETTPAGQTAPQVTWRALSGTFASIAVVPGTGRISAADLASGVYVNGHSLGGFLASTFTRLFGTQANVQQTSTFNSAGFAIGSEPVLAALQAQVGPQLGRQNFPAPGSTSQLNYFATHGLNLTTNTWWFSQVGQRVELFNEESGSQIPNHFMYKLTDALALANAMSKLDPTLTVARANAAFEAGSTEIPADLEGTLDGLRRVLQGPLVQFTPAADVDGSAGTRVQFHANLKALVESGSFTSLAGKIRIDVSSIDLGGKARSDFSAMASLLALSPVVLTAIDAAAKVTLHSQLQTVWGQAFTDWQADGALSLGDRRAGNENYTDKWIADRARLLNAVALQNQRNSATGLALDTTVPADRIYEFQYYGGSPRPGESLPPLQTLIATSRPGVTLPPELIAFGDDSANDIQGGNNQLGDHLYGAGGNDTLKGLAGNDWLEGNLGDDSLQGGDGRDTLLGGVGIDILEGGNNDDALYGGAGIDTYRFAGNWGTDTLRDGDGVLNVIGIGDLTGAGAKLQAPNSWISDDGKITYTRVAANGGQRGYLLISVKGAVDYGTIRIEDWSPGQLGITLGNEAAQPPVAAEYVGDFAKSTNAGGTQYLTSYDSTTGTYRYVGSGAGVDAPDVLNGSNGADLLRGQGGNDGLAGGNGDDTLEGGAGNDLLLGGTGRDSLSGGDGDDVIFGSGLGWVATPGSVGSELPSLPAGMVEHSGGFSWRSYRAPGPRLLGDTAAFQFTDVAGGSTAVVWQEGGSYVIDTVGDVIDGGAGNDYIAAGTGTDIVLGGEGDDDIAGLHGADLLFGDAGVNHNERQLVGRHMSSNFEGAFHANGR